MRPFKIHIKCENESDMKEELRELAYLATGMREWQKKFDSQFGANNREKKKHWEAKMDAWLNKYKVFYNEK